MSRWISFAAVLVCAAAPALAAEGEMTAAERAFLLDQLEQSKKVFLASIHDVTPEQWKFKPAPNVWSVQECAEHIVLAEDYIFGGAQASLQTPVAERLANADADHDKAFADRIKDRTQKATAPEPLVPSGKFATPADAAREFAARRDKTIAYVKTTNAALRVHVMDGPAGKMDAYQMLVLLASHTARHTEQIHEVQANAAYPKALP